MYDVVSALRHAIILSTELFKIKNKIGTPHKKFKHEKSKEIYNVIKKSQIDDKIAVTIAECVSKILEDEILLGCVQDAMSNVVSINKMACVISNSKTKTLGIPQEVPLLYRFNGNENNFIYIDARSGMIGSTPSAKLKKQDIMLATDEYIDSFVGAVDISRAVNEVLNIFCLCVTHEITRENDLAEYDRLTGMYNDRGNFSALMYEMDSVAKIKKSSIVKYIRIGNRIHIIPCNQEWKYARIIGLSDVTYTVGYNLSDNEDIVSEQLRHKISVTCGQSAVMQELSEYVEVLKSKIVEVKNEKL